MTAEQIKIAISICSQTFKTCNTHNVFMSIGNCPTERIGPSICKGGRARQTHGPNFCLHSPAGPRRREGSALIQTLGWTPNRRWESNDAHNLPSQTRPDALSHSVTWASAVTRPVWIIWTTWCFSLSLVHSVYCSLSTRVTARVAVPYRLTLGIGHALHARGRGGRQGWISVQPGVAGACHYSAQLAGWEKASGRSEEVKYGRRLILTAGWVSIREFELRRSLHDMSSQARHESPWWMKAKIGPVGLSGSSPFTHLQRFALFVLLINYILFFKNRLMLLLLSSIQYLQFQTIPYVHIFAMHDTTCPKTKQITRVRTIVLSGYHIRQ